MQNLFAKLWNDDQGAVVAPELVIVIAITILGIIPGLVALRNTSIASMTQSGNALLALQTGFSFAPIAVVSSGGTTIIAFAGGAQFTPTTVTQLTTAATGSSIALVGVAVSPAP